VSESPAFDHTCEMLESKTKLSRLEARGTVRLALKEAGLDAGSVTARQLSVVFERIMPGELRSRGIGDADSICRDLVRSLATLPSDRTADTPESVFGRLGGSVKQSSWRGVGG
jgi:hypothetical protein